MPTVLPTVGRRDPKKTPGMWPLRLAVGITVGMTTPFPVRYTLEAVEGVDRWTMGHNK